MKSERKMLAMEASDSEPTLTEQGLHETEDKKSSSLISETVVHCFVSTLYLELFSVRPLTLGLPTHR